MFFGSIILFYPIITQVLYTIYQNIINKFTEISAQIFFLLNFNWLRAQSMKPLVPFSERYYWLSAVQLPYLKLSICQSIQTSLSSLIIELKIQYRH